MTPGQLTYDLRRLRAHHIIERVPTTNRYHTTTTGIHHTLFLTRLAQHVLIPGIAQLTDTHPPTDMRLRAATRAYEAAITRYVSQAGLAN